MAVIKHIASKNSDYSKIMDYLLFQHDELSGRPVLDEQGRKVLREEYYMDGILCEPMAFDYECKVLNDRYNKNKAFNEIKSHHYIISFDPKDVTEKGLTGIRAHELSMAYAKKCFPGHQVLVVTHTDGHNHSGNIHSHLVLNSLRKLDVEKKDYMDKACEYKAGYKHYLSRKCLRYLKKTLMEMCQDHGLNQVDLLSPPSKKVTEAEYHAARRGQQKLEALNQEIIADGLTPASTTFRTQKQKLRDAIEEVSRIAVSFEDFDSLLNDRYQILVWDKRGRFSYQCPGREKHISERALGTDYGRMHLLEMFEKNRSAELKARDAYRKDPLAVISYPSRLGLVVDLQTCIKARQSRPYAQKVKLSNLRKMADTLVYLQEHDVGSIYQLAGLLSDVTVGLEDLTDDLNKTERELKDLNRQIHFTGQYLANKKTYQQMTGSVSKGLYRKRHEGEIRAYEEARKYLKDHFPDSRIPSMKTLREKKADLTGLRDRFKDQIGILDRQKKDLSVILSNVESILNGQMMDEPVRKHSRSRDVSL